MAEGLDIEALALEIEWRLAEAQHGHVVALWADGSVTVDETRPGPRNTPGGVERPLLEFRRRRTLPSRQAILDRIASLPDPPGDPDAAGEA